VASLLLFLRLRVCAFLLTRPTVPLFKQFAPPSLLPRHPFLTLPYFVPLSFLRLAPLYLWLVPPARTELIFTLRPLFADGDHGLYPLFFRPHLMRHVAGKTRYCAIRVGASPAHAPFPFVFAHRLLCFSLCPGNRAFPKVAGPLPFPPVRRLPKTSCCSFQRRPFLVLFRSTSLTSGKGNDLRGRRLKRKL